MFERDSTVDTSAFMGTDLSTDWDCGLSAYLQILHMSTLIRRWSANLSPYTVTICALLMIKSQVLFKLIGICIDYPAIELIIQRW